MTILTSRVVRVITAVVVIGAVLVFGAMRLLAASPKVEYRTATVQRGNVTQTVAVSGSVNASSQVRLSFKTSGRLAATLVSVGQSVNAGDVLAKLDDADQQTSLRQAQANLTSAQAKYNSVLTGDDLVALKLSLDQTQQTLNRLQANYAAAKTNLDVFASSANADRASANLTFVAAQSTLSTLQNDLLFDAQYADIRTARTTAQTIQANFQQSQVQSAILDQALTDLGTAIAALRTQLANADAGTPNPQQFGAAQASFNAAQTRAQSAVDGYNSQLATALTNANSIIGNLNTTATVSDTTLNQTRTDASALAQQITTAQQQLIAAKSKLGALSGPVQTFSDAITGSSIANAQNSLASTRQSYQTKLNSRDSDVQSALASLQSAQASYDTTKNALANMTLAAPVAGVIAQINSQVGEFASSPFMVLSVTGSLALHGTIGEADVARLKLGQVATITIDAIGTDKRLTGKVTSLDPVATIQSGVPVYGIDVTLDVSDPAIRPGMSGNANVIVANKTDIPVVPNLAIRNLGGRRGVQVLRSGSPVDVTDIQFGISNDQVTEVVSGLAEGDTVVLPTARSSPSGGGQIRFPGVGGGGAVPGR